MTHSTAWRIACLLTLSALLAGCNPQQAVDTPAPATAAAGAPGAKATVVNWGQRSTKVGEDFNVQADGNSGVSFELSQPVLPGEYTITFAGKPLTGVVTSGVIITATIPKDFLAHPGTFPIVIQNPPQGVRIEAGDFTVEQ